jgi:hypothetical protein
MARFFRTKSASLSTRSSMSTAEVKFILVRWTVNFSMFPLCYSKWWVFLPALDGLEPRPTDPGSIELFIQFQTGLRIRITSMRVRINLVTLMRIRIRLCTVMQIRKQVWILLPALWNRDYFLRFRFRLLKSFGSGYGSASGSDF